MEAINCLIFEWSKQALLVCRTMVIRAESKRRKSIANSKDWSRSNSCEKCSLLDYPHQIGCDKDSQSVNAGDVCTTTADTPSPKYYCDPSEMKRVFDLFDENKDGVICTVELQQFMKKVGFELSDQNVKDMVRTVAKNSDDCVDFEEFLQLFSCLRGKEECATGEYNNGHHGPSVGEDADEEETLLRAFFVFDENKDGLISALELQQVLLRLGLPEGRSLMGCQKMIEKVDVDGNGQVDFFEFKEMMCSDAFSFCKS